MSYEKIIHDQALSCANESLELAKELAFLNKQEESAERTSKANELKAKLDANEVVKGTLRYIYKAAGREDLNDLMGRLSVISTNNAIIALSDPRSWEKICEFLNQPTEVDYEVPEKQILKWRLSFLSKTQES